MGDLASIFRDHETHRHKWYGLTCEVFDQMLDACAYSCQVCGCPSSESSCGKLVIDHDGRVGNWAVRGLLCTRCNVTLRVDRDDPDWAKPYLADPWWKRMLAEKDLVANPPEYTDWSLYDGYLIEPTVLDFEGRLWRREKGTWTAGGDSYTWKSLVAMHGPHNLTPRILGSTTLSAREAEVLRGGKGPFEVQGRAPQERVDIALLLLKKRDWPTGAFDNLQRVIDALEGKTVVI